MDELKGLYAAKLRQVSQHAQRSQRSLQLQLYRAQQEKGRAQEELDALRRVKGQEEEEEVGVGVIKGTSPTLEETRWQVCGNKAGHLWSNNNNDTQLTRGYSGVWITHLDVNLNAQNQLNCLALLWCCAAELT